MTENINWLSFTDLVNLWHNDTRYCSDSSVIISHRAYLRIIAMGPKALPHIFEELKKGPDHWYAALAAITGEDPVPEEHRGSMTQMQQDWLTWAKEHLELPKGREPGSWCCQRCGCAEVKFRVPIQFLQNIVGDLIKSTDWRFNTYRGNDLRAERVANIESIDFTINEGD